MLSHLLMSLMPDLRSFDLSQYHQGNYNITTNLFYIVFHFNIPFVFNLLIILRWLIAMVGCVLNAALVYVCFTSKSLYGPCNVLIGTNALCSALFQPHLSIGLMLVLSRQYYINMLPCCLILTLATICYNMILASMLAIGVDRLLCVKFTIWHRNQNQSLYLAIFLGASFLYAAIFVYMTFVISSHMPELQIICSSPDDLYQGALGKYLFQANFAISLLVVIVYGFLWITIMRQKTQLVVGAPNYKIVRSLTAMMLVMVLGWLLNSTMRIMLPMVPEVSPEAMCYATFVSAILPHIAIASNAPILYVFSNDYRRAFHLRMHWLFKHFTHTLPVQTVAPKTAAAVNALRPTNAQKLRADEGATGSNAISRERQQQNNTTEEHQMNRQLAAN